MRLSDSMSVLLTDFPSASPQLTALRSILEAAGIQVLIENGQANSSEDRPNPSLIIRSVDGLRVDDQDHLLPDFPVNVPVIIAAQNF